MLSNKKQTITLDTVFGKVEIKHLSVGTGEQLKPKEGFFKLSLDPEENKKNFARKEEFAEVKPHFVARFLDGEYYDVSSSQAWSDEDAEAPESEKEALKMLLGLVSAWYATSLINLEYKIMDGE